MRIETNARWLPTIMFGLIAGVPVFAEGESAPPQHPERVEKFLERLYHESHRKYSFRSDVRGGFVQWQQNARPELRELLGLRQIEAQLGNHQPTIELAGVTSLNNYSRQQGWIETEPNVRIPFWLLRPTGPGPFPLAILPHGHDKVGHDTYAGIYPNKNREKTSLAEDRDVGVQAVRRGFLAIVPATRGLAVDGVPDVYRRHGGSNCRSQLIHCLLVGRTAIGERVWDLERLLDWAIARSDVDSRHVLMMGNSGGGMATLHTAACDERVTVAVASCSFSTITSAQGRIYHCDCNLVPGILEWGELYDVAGLIAPRYCLAVNGRKDKLHVAADVERSAARAQAIFKAAGQPERFEHRWGAEGHRFYSDLMWPFVMRVLKD